MLHERLDLSLIISLLVQQSPGLSHTRAINALLDEYYQRYLGRDTALLCRVAKGRQQLPEDLRVFFSSPAGYDALLTALSSPPLSYIPDMPRIAEILENFLYIDSDISEAQRERLTLSLLGLDPYADALFFIVACTQFACQRPFFPRHKNGSSSYYDTYPSRSSD